MTFNDALREAVARHGSGEWPAPVGIWLKAPGSLTPVSVTFSARPPGYRPEEDEELFRSLNAATLALGAEFLGDRPTGEAIRCFGGLVLRTENDWRT